MHEEYERRINSLRSISFDQIRSTAHAMLKKYFSSEEIKKQYVELKRGVDIIRREELLWRYLYAFGNMHRSKMRLALKRLGDLRKIVSQEYTIIDWGCGQALASCCFMDYIHSFNNANLPERSILIDPSSLALRNAELHLSAYGIRRIERIEKTLDEVCSEDVANESPVTIHLFSNILDVESIDLRHLATVIGDAAASGTHYFICVSPFYSNSQRISQFKNYFIDIDNVTHVHRQENAIEVLAEDRLAKTGEKFTMEMLLFRYTAGKSSVYEVGYFPPARFSAAYQLDCVRKSPDQYISALETQSDSFNFDVMAPFDLGASAYQDVNPVLAALSNIITRGLPTKCSPFIEEAFIPDGNTPLPDNLGSLAFCAPAPSGRQSMEARALSPIGVARIQKTIIEAFIAGRIPLDSQSLRILAKERDVPCAALAIRDLSQLFNNLVSLSVDYKGLSFPAIDLTVVCQKQWANSPLHLDAKVVDPQNKPAKAQVYDLVIDVSVQSPLDRISQKISEYSCPSGCYFAIGNSTNNVCSRMVYTSDFIEYQPLGEFNRFGVFEENERARINLTYFLQLLFRKRSFREGQVPILNRAIQGKNVIGLLPTGGGKSLTYQLAALLQPGVSIVVDPLRALMKDQYEGLLDNGIDACTYINSNLTNVQRHAAEDQLVSSKVLFTFLSPERLCIAEFRQRLQAMHQTHVYFAYGVIDEVHCVSEWGHDFRFSYLHLGRNLYRYVKPKREDRPLSLFGLTATASFDVLADVERELSGEGAYVLDAGALVRYENTDRLELQYHVVKVPVEFKRQSIDPRLPKAVLPDFWAGYDSKKNFLHDHIRDIQANLQELQYEESINRIKRGFADRQNEEYRYETIDLSSTLEDDILAKKEKYHQAGIIFCPHKKNTGVSVFKNAENLSTSISCDIGTFVGSSDDDNQKSTDEISFRNLELFKEDKQALMVATKAFGMGIDKPNVRFTINLNYSSSLESFVQEAGRAGRDRKIALATVYVSDYNLARIKPDCPLDGKLINTLKGCWFNEKDLHYILDGNGLSVPRKYVDIARPEDDWVNLDEKKLSENQRKRLKDAHLEHLLGWHKYDELIAQSKEAGFELSEGNYSFLNSDYGCNMYFYSTNFVGANKEKQIIHRIFCNSKITLAEGNTNDLVEYVLEQAPEMATIAFVTYEKDNKTNPAPDEKKCANVQKAIYRMCCIGFIDDFTQDYNLNQFKVTVIRKPDGAYFDHLKKYLLRYYMEDRANELVEQARSHSGNNEIQKCIEFLTDFTYEKIAKKRKRAIDDMRLFCKQGLDETKDWKEVNEQLKDFIYYYFNSKYANEDYVTDRGETFSLTADTEHGKKSSEDIALKYTRVVEADLVEGGGTPIDNIKHLQGAIRLIRRSLTDSNPALDLLNSFCLIQLGTNDNESLENELIQDFQQGMAEFSERSESLKEFWSFFEMFCQRINELPHTYEHEKLLAVEDETIARLQLSALKHFTHHHYGDLMQGANNER